VLAILRKYEQQIKEKGDQNGQSQARYGDAR
jgi:hypothetical protein